MGENKLIWVGPYESREKLWCGPLDPPSFLTISELSSSHNSFLQHCSDSILRCDSNAAFDDG